MVAGYTGTQQRTAYTSIGDTANLAARLKAQTKQAGDSILLDGDTQAVRHHQKRRTGCRRAVGRPSMHAVFMRADSVAKQLG